MPLFPPTPRVHVGPRDWGAPATDFWVIGDHADTVTASGATNLSGLDSFGWTTTSLILTAGVDGDFLSAADDLTTRFGLDGANDVLLSPTIFGSYGHGQMVAEILGYTPTKLVLDMFAAFPTNSANEATTFMGFSQAAVTDATAAGSGGAVTSDGTNFVLKSDNGSDVGALLDTLFHKFRIVVDATNTEWFIDGTSQGTITTEADIWPLAFKMVAGTTNRLRLGWAHIWYG